MKFKYIIEENDIAVKDFLKKKGYSSRFLTKVGSQDCIQVNQKNKKNYYKLQKGDILVVDLPESISEDIEINDKKIDILYEDEYLLVIEKESNLSSQPSRKHPMDNLISILKNHFIKNDIPGNIHLVSRLDFATSGIVIVAKHGLIHYLLSQTKITKEYLLETVGIPKEKKGRISLPIKRCELPSIKRTIALDGKEAITEYVVTKQKEETAIIKAKLITGRTHQLRLHFSHLGFPIVGDNIYGEGREIMHLHAYRVSFLHPITKEKIEIINMPKW